MFFTKNKPLKTAWEAQEKEEKKAEQQKQKENRKGKNKNKKMGDGEKNTVIKRERGNKEVTTRKLAKQKRENKQEWKTEEKSN